MRVISGKFKKKKLLLPDPKITRPLRDYVKESLFNLLTHAKSLNFKFEKSIVLDIFSGSGSLGIECLSRGSEKVVFIEKNKDSLATLNKNIKNLFLNIQCDVIFGDFLKIDFNEVLKKNVDLIFLDPPFEYKFLEEMFNKLEKHQDKLKKSLLVIHYEESNEFKFDIRLNIIMKKSMVDLLLLLQKLRAECI